MEVRRPVVPGKVTLHESRWPEKTAPLSKLHMSGLGKWVMLRLMKDARLPALEEMIGLAKGMGVKFMACTTSMGMMGISKGSIHP